MYIMSSSYEQAFESVFKYFREVQMRNAPNSPLPSTPLCADEGASHYQDKHCYSTTITKGAKSAWQRHIQLTIPIWYTEYVTVQ